MKMSRMSDEALISDYVDGRLSGPERAAFEARLLVDAGLRRQLAVTRLLADQSRRMETVPAPKNFILPLDFGKSASAAAPARRRDWRLLFFRFGSVAAAMVFVFAVAFDTLRSTSAPAAVPMAAIAQATATPEAAIAPGTQPHQATIAPMQTPAAAMSASTPMMQSRAMPADAMSAMSADTPILPPEAITVPAPESLPSVASAESMTITAHAPAATAQAIETPATPLPAAPLITPLRVVAALALAVTIALGIIGWRK